MTSKVALTASLQGTAYGPTPRPQLDEQPQDHPASPEEDADSRDLRLIIEEDGDGGCCVYTIVDRKTGKVVSRLSREQVLRMKEAPGYAAGTVFSGKA